MVNITGKLGNSNLSVSTTIQRVQSSNATVADTNDNYISEQFRRNEISEHVKTDAVLQTQKQW